MRGIILRLAANERRRLVKALQSILRRMRQHPVQAALVVMLAVLLVVFLDILFSDRPTWAYRLFGVEEKFRILEFVGVAMGGMLLAVGAAIAHRRAKAMERAAKAQAEAAKAHAEANKGAEDGRRQERLKNAIEHLGHASDSVRLGGAYELFHLAKDTEDLRQTVLDILCAYIRRTTGEGEYRDKYKSKPSEEIQSLLTLLFVQDHEVFRSYRINLQGSWLAGSNLVQAFLLGADLSMAYLQRSDLSGGRLQEAYLFGARMQRSHLCRACLQGTDLSMAELQGSNLFGAQMQGVKLYKTQMQEAILSDASLQGAVSQLAPMSSFGHHIRMGIGQKSDLSKATFEGGLRHEDVAALASIMPNEAAEELQQALERHIDQPEVHELPDSSRAIVGEYTEEEAKRWIAEYEKARGKSPKADG